MIEFNHASYRSQVLRLSKLARTVLKKFPIKVVKIDFIHHGENTTFKVTARNQKHYLLRIHRHGYHNFKALKQELQWLETINGSGLLRVQKPMLSIGNKLLECEYIPGMDHPRYCDLLSWQDGMIKRKEPTSNNFFEVGRLTGVLHSLGRGIPCSERVYWNARGLASKNPTFGEFDCLETIFGKDFEIIEKLRRLVFSKLDDYEKNNPDNVSMIHADLHFGNLVWQGNRVTPIDFDDCGLGGQPYDFAVTLHAGKHRLKSISARKRIKCFEDYFLGYSTVGHIGKEELDITEYYLVARHFDLLIWLYERRDHSKLWDILQQIKKDELKYLKKAYDEGPDPIFS